MKFQANLTLELKAGSIDEAGKRLDQLLKQAADEHGMSARAVELRTPPGDAAAAAPVILPPITTRERPTGPQAVGIHATARGPAAG